MAAHSHELLRYGTILAVLLVFLFFVVRPLLQSLTARPAPRQPHSPVAEAPGLAASPAALLTRIGATVTEPLRTCGADDFSFYGGVAPALMLFAGTGGQPGSGLHTATFLPGDRAVADVADALLAGYLAGCAAITG